MPELAGLTLAEAEARMSAAGLKLGKLTFAPTAGCSTRRRCSRNRSRAVAAWRPAPPVDLQLSRNNGRQAHNLSPQALVLNCPLAS